MPPKAQYRILQGTATAIQSELNKLNTDASWKPILMTSVPIAGGTSLCVIAEHLIGTS